MHKAIKKEIILEGLNCAHCASKIEEMVRHIEGVSAASLNFISKTLIIEIDNEEKIDKILKKTNDIIKKLEPEVIITEKVIEKKVRKVLTLIGLDCAHCAAKIEKEIKNIKGIEDARVDFISKKLILEFTDKSGIDEITENAVKVAKNLESGLQIIDEEHNECACGHHHGEHKAFKNQNYENKTNKIKMARFGISAVIFGLAVILKLSLLMEFTLFFISYLLVGGEVLIKAVRNMLRGQIFDENFLMAIATVCAFSIKEFPEGVAVMLFYQIGEFFQDYAVNRSRRSIKALMDIRPDYANLKRGNEIIKVSPEEVEVGSSIIVKPGEKIPLDGIIIDGKSMIDTSALTGESVPRMIKTGEEVLAGFINKSGVLTVKVSKEFGDTTVSKILDMVQNASSRKAPTENFITKFARYYTPAVVISAILLAVLPPLLIQGATFTEWLNRALVFLVVSCPCALVISIPLSFFGGIGGASRNGILIKGSNYLEALNTVDTIVFDKTGTLTKGTFNVTQVNTVGKINREDLLKIAAYAESYSNHPIAMSIMKAYGKQVNKEVIKNYDEISGYGVKAVIENNEVLVGNIKLMRKENIEVEDGSTIGTVVYVAVDKKYVGNIVISDEIKYDSKDAIHALKEFGVRNIVMLTGDSNYTGTKVAESLGIETVYTELLPLQKVEKLEMLCAHKMDKGKVVFVGDGINDAPVLARADIGIAMGGLGSDAAIEAADVILMTDEPSKIVTAMKVAKKTRSIVWQNIVFAFSIKLLVLILGAGGIATMWEAVFADVGVALIAILNAMRAMKVDRGHLEELHEHDSCCNKNHSHEHKNHENVIQIHEHKDEKCNCGHSHFVHKA